MNKEEMIEVILNHQNEIQEHYNVCCKEFGYYDQATLRNQTQLATILLLTEKLGIDEN